MTLHELAKKDVVHIKTGDNLGRVDDVAFDEASARIQALVLYGRPKLFGLLGREPDVTIDWGDVVNLGTDVILVQAELPRPQQPARIGLLDRFFQGR